MGVSKNRGFYPQIIHLFIGFGTIIFTIHFGGFYTTPIFGSTPISNLEDVERFGFQPLTSELLNLRRVNVYSDVVVYSDFVCKSLSFNERKKAVEVCNIYT